MGVAHCPATFELKVTGACNNRGTFTTNLKRAESCNHIPAYEFFNRRKFLTQWTKYISIKLLNDNFLDFLFSKCRWGSPRILANETGSRCWSQKRRFSHLRVGSVNESTLRVLRHTTGRKLLWELSGKSCKETFEAWRLMLTLLDHYIELSNEGWSKKKLRENCPHELSFQWTSLAQDQRRFHWKGCEWSESFVQRRGQHRWRWTWHRHWSF